MATTETEEIHRLLTPGVIRVGLGANSKREIIDQMVDLLEDSQPVSDIERMRQAVLDREEIMSTGVGKGLALPHAKTDAVRDTVAAFAVTEKPVDFGAIDNKPVRIIFLLVGPDAAKSHHIKLLSRVSRLMNRETFRERLLAAGSAREIIEIFREGEEQMPEI